MISALTRTANLLEEDLPNRLIRADDSLPPPHQRGEGYSYSHVTRLALPFRGCHKMEIAREGKRVTVLPERGAVTLMPAGVWNRVDWYTPVEVATFIFDREGTFINHIICNGEGRQKSLLLRTALPPLDERSALLLNMLTERSLPGEERDALRITWLLLREILRRGGERTGKAEGKADRTYREICSWLSENWTSRPSREEVAALFKITPNYLSQLFRSRGGRGYSDYLTNLRMIHAGKLLTEERMTLAEVGSLCGYRDPAYFCRQFKKATGKTPTEFRIGRDR